ncbi:citrate lyase subunit beta / citryl-CoA lyase [Hathewaya proteolytica DSM 3090]|uniref:Citrate lyase subunit beta / citryl-CoA lyase n=1 Tax=Hathewaya proteolytica DSM 3090 TaxID=1121331 RepID=A0A1M6PX56_9CLOT|nr:aldolase/citrate lyase family protein [Hathewaya proteolytica]SHK12529.1 citrate lyase subunit beta / citryl-CoA lyase [Hathewaya proteolytica DSM 3090]
MKRLRRTMLFMPGNNPSMLQSADILGADSIILDLEDAVSLTEKDSARILVREAVKSLHYKGVEVVVRINPLDTEYAMDDIDNIARVKPDTILVPKATEEAMEKVDAELTRIEKEEGFEPKSIRLFALVESAYGVENVYSIIKSSDRIEGVLLGGEDFTSDMGVKRTKQGDEILYARNKVATACRACRVDSIDTPFTDTNDFEGLIADTTKAKNLGFTGKASINPRQIESIHSVYAPTEAEIVYAEKVMEAKEEALAQGLGVFSLNGKMVDLPVINRAKTTLELAKILGLR